MLITRLVQETFKLWLSSNAVSKKWKHFVKLHELHINLFWRKKGIEIFQCLQIKMCPSLPSKQHFIWNLFYSNSYNLFKGNFKSFFNFLFFSLYWISFTQGLEKFQMSSLMEMKQIYTQKMRFSFPMHPYYLTFENLRVKVLSF